MLQRAALVTVLMSYISTVNFITAGYFEPTITVGARYISYSHSFIVVGPLGWPHHLPMAEQGNFDISREISIFP